MSKGLHMQPGRQPMQAMEVMQHWQAALRSASSGALSGATFPFFTGK
ncbi:hypothetical protein CPter291_2567 [Collimonas pratensis]|uniref:Uncharacterized protein n=1 Tax=Collimonas pratensis TaxID=279113 RepID=A0A127QXB2_9BURK|nr:hypothetical protein CPter91_2770 [Collimonas pratensis]AMP14824.1 hypothetical protein CPter291_2567 [Collimonas pratensis]